MGDGTYNGWSNYATWRVNLEILSDFADSLISDRRTFTDVADIADAFEQEVEEALTQQGLLEDCLALDYARSFVSDVNYREIAEHYTDDLIPPVMVECPDCEGTCFIGEGDDERECPRCNGTGEIPEDDLDTLMQDGVLDVDALQDGIVRPVEQE